MLGRNANGQIHIMSFVRRLQNPGAQSCTTDVDLLGHPVLPCLGIGASEIQSPRLLIQPHVFTCLEIGVPGNAVTLICKVGYRLHRPTQTNGDEENVSKEGLIDQGAEDHKERNGGQFRHCHVGDYAKLVLLTKGNRPWEL